MDLLGIALDEVHANRARQSSQLGDVPMYASSMWLSTGALLRRQRAAVSTFLALCALLSALLVPAGVDAAPRPSAVAPAPVSALAPGEVEEVLDSVPLSELPTGRLSETLAGL